MSSNCFQRYFALALNVITIASFWQSNQTQRVIAAAVVAVVVVFVAIITVVKKL